MASLYACGSGSDGQLGFGNDDLCPKIHLSKVPGPVGDVCAIACGDEHTLVLYDGDIPEKQTLFSCGSGQNGRNGHLSRRRELTQVLNLPIDLGKYVGITCGRAHSLLWTEKGEVVGFGKGEQLGCGIRTDVFKPIMIPFFSSHPVSKVCCGWDHALAIGCDHRLYAWGIDLFHQLGKSTPGTSLLPTLVHFPHTHSTVEGEREESTFSHVTHAAAGLSHSVAVTDGNVVWGWGDNRTGQVGVGEQITRQIMPARLPSFLSPDETITHIACGAFHTLAATSKGNLYEWGMYHTHCHNTHRWTPTPVHLPTSLLGYNQGEDKIWSVVTCGAFHSIVVDSNGVGWTWGKGNDYQLANGTRDNVDSPFLIPIHSLQNVSPQTSDTYYDNERNDNNNNSDVMCKVTHAAAGWAHTVLVITPI